MVEKFVEDEIKPSGPFNRVLFLSTIIIVVCTGFYIFSTIVAEVKEYEGTIEVIEPPGITNIVPIAIMVFVSVIAISIILKYTGDNTNG